jgi:hypothetical protein
MGVFHFLRPFISNARRIDLFNVDRSINMVQANSENRGGDLVVVTTIFLALSWFSVSTRVGVRVFLTNSFDIDDWLMLLALVRLSPENAKITSL